MVQELTEEVAHNVEGMDVNKMMEDVASDVTGGKKRKHSKKRKMTKKRKHSKKSRKRKGRK
jgi:hypothetical protein